MQTIKKFDVLIFFNTTLGRAPLEILISGFGALLQDIFYFAYAEA